MRKEKTGEIRLVHVKAHENVDDVHKAGNKCADVLAGKGRLMGPDRELELMREGKQVYWKQGNGCYTRRHTRKQIQLYAKDRLREGLVEGNTQMIAWEPKSLGEWCRRMKKEGLKGGTLIRIATNALFKEVYTSTRPAGQVDCICGEGIASTEHMWSCNEVAGAGKMWKDEVVHLVGEHSKGGPVREWPTQKMLDAGERAVFSMKLTRMGKVLWGIRTKDAVIGVFSVRQIRRWLTRAAKQLEDCGEMVEAPRTTIWRDSCECESWKGYHGDRCRSRNHYSIEPGMIRELAHVMGITGIILNSVVNREVGDMVLHSGELEEQKLGARALGDNLEPKLWLWSEGVGRKWTMMAEDVHTMMSEGEVGPSIGVIMRRGSKRMNGEVEAWGKEKGMEAEVMMELSGKTKMRYPSNWKRKGTVREKTWKVWVIRIGNPVGKNARTWEFGSKWLDKRTDIGDRVYKENWRRLWVGKEGVRTGDRVRNWVEKLMRREREGRRFFGKSTATEVEEIRRLGITRPMEVMREIEKITVKMVMKYHDKIKMAIRRPPWQGGEGGRGEARCEGLWGGDEGIWEERKERDEGEEDEETEEDGEREEEEEGRWGEWGREGWGYGGRRI